MRAPPRLLIFARVSAMLHLTAATQRATATRLAAAVHRNQMFSREGVLERMFTLAFRGLVYPQICDDPPVDLAALQILPTEPVIALLSGTCYLFHYLYPYHDH